jgi:pimeloyl-ACP methyl ester carboxylesterase
MRATRITTRALAWRTFITGLALIVVAAVGTGAASAAPPKSAPKAKPTIVLVHGAWADSGAWDAVVRKLQHDGYPVDVFPTPLRSLLGDSGYLSQYLAAISGPIVLVGHSYGGAVATDAATGNPNIKALVYIDAFAPDQGESVLQLAGSASALANPDPTKVFSFVPQAAATPTTDLYVLPAVFPSAFANDLPSGQAKALAATQRPVTFGALNDMSTAPAWRTIPSWYQVGTIDKVIPQSQQLMMANRAHSHVITVRASHLPMISQPNAVQRTIETAAAATS